jgi:hypothetical protein
MKLKYAGLFTTCSLNVINHVILKLDKYKPSLSFIKYHTMRAYGKEVRYERICAVLTLALDESE